MHNLSFHCRAAGKFIAILLLALPVVAQSAELKRYLYVAQPGIRNYTQFGGHGIIVYDIDNDYEFVRRIPFSGLKDDKTPDNIKGICGNAATGRLYVSTIKHLICINLLNDEVLWERQYEFGCDRMSMSPDGKLLYQPSFEKDVWYVLDAETGDEVARVTPKSRAHNTVYGNDGKSCYLAGLGSPMLTVADTSKHTIAKQVGPFAANIRPFTINGDQSLCFVNINDLLGFEIGDLKTGQKRHRVEVQGFERGPVKRHGCPSHGIGLTRDEREVWVTDGHNSHLHIFDATVMPPKQVHSIKLRAQPGWVTFSLDGKTCWPSTGDVIDVATRKITKTLTDEKGRMVMSEKLLEVQFDGKNVVAVGDQFGKGYAEPTNDQTKMTDDELAKALVGSWKIIGATNDGQPSKLHYSCVTIKHITPNQFVWLSYKPEDRKTFRSSGGSWKVENGQYVETARYGTRDDYRNHGFGVVTRIDCEIKDDIFTQTITSREGKKFVEVFQRMKPNEDADEIPAGFRD